MMANDLTFDQVSAVFQEVVNQATGVNQPAVVDTASFVSVGQTALLAGYDPIMSAISQVISRTIFSIRPYNRKFRGMRVTETAYGNHMRKINPIDAQLVNNAEFEVGDNAEIDQYKAPNPKVLQVNFYGQETFSIPLKTFYRQLNSAFQGPEEFGQFIAMMSQNADDVIEQTHESVARMVLANLIAGIYSASPNQTIHLLSEYNAEMGTTYTRQEIMDSGKYGDFMSWVYARIATLSAGMTDRTSLNHFNITGKTIMRHTPYDRQRVYLLAGDRFMMEKRVLADKYHDNYLYLADTETLNYWQSPLSPSSLWAKPTVLQPDGSLKAADEGVSVSNLFGIIMDEEAAGYSMTNHWVQTTPMNAKGGFWVTWWHFTDKYWNDFTENAIVLCMD